MTSVTLGLLSDTHMPDRWPQLPQRLPDIFAQVDIIIHAGDVGELWVLDEIGKIAPVLAVHGNDEPSITQSALPYLQTTSIAGHRLVVSHAHYPNRAEELASRTDPWQPKFERRAAFARSYGATICIFGHTHIPMLQTYQDVLLVNPGAIAAGNPWSRQLVQTVALMTLIPDQAPQVQFIDLATGNDHTPFYDAAGFRATSTPYIEPIFEAHFMPHREWVWYHLRPLALPAVHQALLGICHEVWRGDRPQVTTAALVERFTALDLPQINAALTDHPYFSQYL